MERSTSLPLAAGRVRTLEGGARPRGSRRDRFLPRETSAWRGHRYPAEIKLLHAVRKGEDCIVGGYLPDIVSLKETGGQGALDAVTVRAGFLRFLVLGGDEKAPVHDSGIILHGAWIISESARVGLDLQHSTLAAPLTLENCLLTGTVRLNFARLKFLRMVNCQRQDEGRTFIDLTGAAVLTNVEIEDVPDRAPFIEANGVAIGGNLTIECDASEQLRLNFDNAMIGGDTRIVAPTPSGTRIGFTNAEFKGELECRDLKNDAEVRLPGARVGGSFTCDNSRIRSLSMRAVDIAGDFWCLNSHIKSLRMQAVRIAGDGHFGNPLTVGHEIDLARSRINGNLVFSGLNFAAAENDDNSGFQLILRNARIGRFATSPTEWPKNCEFDLDGCRYWYLSGDLTNHHRHWWKAWFARQIERHRTLDFKPQPYEQLAKVLRKTGHEAEAREVLFEKRRQMARVRRQYPDSYGRSKDATGRIVWFSRRLWEGIEQFTVGYGFKPLRAMGWLTSLIVFMSLLYTGSSWRGIMTPTQPLVYLSPAIASKCERNWVKASQTDPICAAAMPEEYTSFNGLVYSIDVGIPLVEFGQEKNWSPRTSKPDGSNDWEGIAVRCLMYAQIILGWVISLLFVSAISGIIRRE